MGVIIPLLFINKDKLEKKLKQLRYVENVEWLTAFLLTDMNNSFSSITSTYNVISLWIPAVKSNGLVHRY